MEDKHSDFLMDCGFHPLNNEHTKFVSGIFFIAIREPKNDGDRGKVLILRKPNTAKLMDEDKRAAVCYKGRYIFDGKVFVQMLFHHIGYYDYVRGVKNREYQWNDPQSDIGLSDKLLDSF